MSQPSVTAIVVAYNSADVLEACLRSLLNAPSPPDDLIVIDNASADGSADFVRTRFPTARVFEYGANVGFAAGNNRAARVAEGDCLFLLNPDARVERDTLRRLCEALEAEPRAAIAGPKLVADDGRLCSAGLRADRIFAGADRGYGKDPARFDEPGEVLGVTGAAMLIRRSVFEALGGFDERYFMYYEDLDLCIRARLAGWKTLYVPQALAHHPVRDADRPLLHSEYFDCRNRLRTILKNVSWGSFARLYPRVLVHELVAMKNHLLNRRWHHARLRAAAWLWHELFLLDTLRARRRVQGMRIAGDDAFLRFLDDGEARLR